MRPHVRRTIYCRLNVPGHVHRSEQTLLDGRGAATDQVSAIGAETDAKPVDVVAGQTATMTLQPTCRRATGKCAKCQS